MNCIFVQARCRPGSAYEIASQIANRELHSELYSTSGVFDLIVKYYMPEGKDIGHFVNDAFKEIDAIEHTLTTLTFKAF